MAHPVPSAIVVHRNRDVNAPKVHCPKADRNVEKRHHMMNPRAESVVGGTVGAHAKAHHHEAGAAHDEQTKCSTANTEPTTTVRTAHVDSPPTTRHMAWETFYCLGLLCMSIYRPQHYIESLMSWNATNARCRSHGSSSWDVLPTRENTWPSHGGNVCSSGGSNVVNGRGTPTVSSAIVVHRKPCRQRAQSPLPKGRP